MRYTTSNFYKSKEWESFRRVIISQRVNPANGFVYCWHCGKPIIHKYDLILHHKTELDDINVNDATIALNPDNVECVHFKCHNVIHNRFQGGNNGYKPQPKKVIIFYGSPLSGKSTYVRQISSPEDLIIDIDKIYFAISNNEMFVKPDRLRGTVFGVRDYLYDVVKYRNGKWQNAYIITGGARLGDRERLAKRVNATETRLIEATREACLERARRERPEAWIGYVNDWFDSYQPDPE